MRAVCGGLWLMVYGIWYHNENGTPPFLSGITAITNQKSALLIEARSQLESKMKPAVRAVRVYGTIPYVL